MQWETLLVTNAYLIILCIWIVFDVWQNYYSARALAKEDKCVKWKEISRIFVKSSFVTFVGSYQFIVNHL